MRLQRLAIDIGAGLLGGFAGTAAITVSQTVEMLLTGRKPSDSPAQAAQKVLRIEPKDETGKGRLVQAVHWAYGTGWGMFRPLAALMGVKGWAATVLHWGAIQEGAMLVLPALRVAPPAREWRRQELGVEMFHHFIYAAAGGLVFEAVLRGGRAPRLRVSKNGLIAILLGTALAPLILGQAHGKPEKKSAGKDIPEETEELEQKIAERALQE